MSKHFPDKSVGTCPECGKEGTYPTRKAAKRAARRQRQYGRMPPYRCESDNGYWHIGHLDPKVIRGTLTRDERYR